MGPRQSCRSMDFFFFSSRRRHTRFDCDWSSDVCSSDLKARTKTLTIPRQVAMYLARNMLAMQLVEIGQAFGGRDHSTVIHSVDKVERRSEERRVGKECRSRWSPYH